MQDALRAGPQLARIATTGDSSPAVTRVRKSVALSQNSNELNKRVRCNTAQWPAPTPAIAKPIASHSRMDRSTMLKSSRSNLSSVITVQLNQYPNGDLLTMRVVFARLLLGELQCV